MIIGLTGENCAGKTTAADHLKKKSFYYFSLSDVIRDELRSEETQITRENLIKKGNILREKYGPGALGRKIAEKIQDDKNYVIDSIRNPAEVEELQNLGRFFLFYITAPERIRFERNSSRNRGDESRSFEEFIELEQKEMENIEKTKQNLRGTFSLASKKIENDSSISDFHEKIDKAILEISNEFSLERPGWDEYFMRIAKVVASRSNCVKRKVAAIIVKDKRIISTGYNGTPRGTKNCSEGGCPRCNDFSEGGKNLENCYCSHGEENAIVQAAYHGISVKDSVLYTTFSPCLICTKMIINAGISGVVYNEAYPILKEPLQLLKEAGVEVRKHRI